MALELTRELSTGISGNYWRIGSVVVSCNDDPLVSIYMELYLNRAAKYSGKTPLLIEPTNMNLSQIDPTFDFDFRACVYNAMSNLPSWTNSKYIYEFDETYETRPIVNFVEVESDFNGSVELPAFQGSDLNNLPLTYEISAQPQNGIISESNGIFTYTPNPDWAGEDIAEYRCSNGTEFSKPAKIYLIVKSRIPTANNISAEADFNGSVLLNLNGSDPFNLPLTFVIKEQPVNGTIDPNTFMYTPNPNWSGNDIAKYVSDNGLYESSLADISLTVVSDAPTVMDTSADCESNSSIDFEFGGSDPNNLPLTFSIVDQPANGLISESNGIFTYTPNADFIGLDSATYKANNGTYDSNVAIININVTANE